MEAVRDRDELGAWCEEQKNKNVKLEKIRKLYIEKIFYLEQQIKILNAKVKDYQYEALKVNANISESAKNQHQIELLENELRTQEELIAGYQHENHSRFRSGLNFDHTADKIVGTLFTSFPTFFKCLMSPQLRHLVRCLFHLLGIAVRFHFL